MSKEELIAIIASASALLVAIVGLLSSLQSARLQRRTQIALEALRHDMGLDLERRHKQNELLKYKIDLTTKDIELLQSSRDALRRLIDAPRGTARLSDIINMLSRTIKDMEAQYSKHYSSDEDSSYLKYVHEAKSTLAAIEIKLTILAPNIEYTSDIGDDARSDVRFANMHIHFIQEQLRDHNLKMVADYASQ